MRCFYGPALFEQLPEEGKLGDLARRWLCNKVVGAAPVCRQDCGRSESVSVVRNELSPSLTIMKFQYLDTGWDVVSVLPERLFPRGF